MNEKQFTFTYNKAIEFQIFILALSSDEFFKFLESNNNHYDEEAAKLIKELRSKLTQYMKWELNYFFVMEEFNIISLGMMLSFWYLLNNPSIVNVEQFIDKMEQAESEEIMKITFYTHYYFMNKVPKDFDINIDKNNLINIVKNANIKSNEMKERIIESLESPDSTKQRFILLMKEIYYKIYQGIETIIEEKVCKQVEFFKDLHDKDHNNFTKSLLKTDYDVFGNKVIVHISYFWNIDFWYSPNNKGDELIVLGINTKEVDDSINPKVKIYNFLKTISDKTRLEIIELLSERTWYVNELAEKLNVSTATISYHLSRLQDLNIVDFKREDQRFYYFIKKEILKMYFHESANLLIKGKN